MTESRVAIRTRMRAQREALGPRERLRAAQAVVTQLEQIPELMTDTRVAGYFAVHGEIALNFLVPQLHARSQHYFLPIIGPNKQMRFAQWQVNQTLVHNAFGIPEPSGGGEAFLATEMDVILLPLLAFDVSGNRIGTGGGYYDRCLQSLRTIERPAKPLLVGVAYGFQQIKSIAEEPWDVQLDYIATEQSLIDCNVEAEK